jgi:crotonobetainyl-CoA:carnitine CoA-transferase CaiB-like acyl-CoA transferase
MTAAPPWRPGPGPAGVLRIAELAQEVAGPVCGRLFAALGHDVRKCEPPGGDVLRRRPPLGDDGTSLGFAALNAGKQSAPAGSPGDLRNLLAGADVLITDLAPSAAAQFGVSPGQLRLTHPDLVIVSVTAFGLDDELSERWGDSLLAEAYGGLASMIGDPARRPLSLGGEQAAYAAGIVGFFGAMLALRRRDQGAGGDLVDVAMSDVAAYIDWKSDIGYAVTGTVPTRAGTQSGRWRMLSAADGAVGVIFQPEQWDALVTLIGDERLADPALRDEQVRETRVGEWWPAVQDWLAARPKRDAYRQAQALRLAFGYHCDVADLASDEQYRSRGFVTADGLPGPLVHGIPWHSGPVPSARAAPLPAWPPRPPRPRRPAAPAPLAGVRVLDLGTITAGAAVGRLLSDYGATVLKVESPTHPDQFRRWLPTGAPAELAATLLAAEPMFASNNAGKRGVLIDLSTTSGHAKLLRLASESDIVIENFRVGVTAKLGIDAQALLAVNPHLIYLSLSSHGQDGPEARYRSYGSTLDLLSGLASVTGYDADTPIWSSIDVNYPDQLVSFLGAAITAYCLRQGIRGVHLDLAQREAVTWTLAEQIADFRASGRIARPSGNRRPGRTPHDTYPCAGTDQWVAIACRSAAERTALAAVIGFAEGAVGSESWWTANQDRADAAIVAWTSLHARDQCVTKLAEAGVPCAPVLTAAERAADPHFLRRRVFLPGPPRLKGFPLVLGGYQPPVPGPAPSLNGQPADRLQE